MKGPREKPENEPELVEIPQRLGEDLAALYRARLEVPREVDERITARARRQVGRRRRPAVPWRSSAAAAAAAALLVTVWVADPLGWRVPAEPLAREDVDRDGRVDVLDAFLLARRLHSGAAVERSWDLTGDGVVDRRDVDVVAAAAARLR